MVAHGFWRRLLELARPDCWLKNRKLFFSKQIAEAWNLSTEGKGSHFFKLKKTYFKIINPETPCSEKANIAPLALDINGLLDQG